MLLKLTDKVRAEPTAEELFEDLGNPSSVGDRLYKETASLWIDAFQQSRANLNRATTITLPPSNDDENNLNKDSKTQQQIPHDASLQP